MAAIPLAQFLERLGQSKVLEPEQEADLASLQAQFTDFRQFAQELIRREWLTAYQVNQLAQGRSTELVLGDYVILERLGEGGMGQVFKARQRKHMQRTVALKVVRRECVDNPKAIKRFQREIKAAGLLSHPNIVHAYDADEIDGTQFIAMEYIQGVDLARLVKDQGPLLVAQACDYMRQAALGLQHAHERGLVHRDIKPANLLVTQAARHGSATLPRPSSGVLLRPGSGLIPRMPIGGPWGLVKILDMGLARLSNSEGERAMTHLTQMGTLMGTPDFIAPEQAVDSRTSDIRSDLYSLGCTLYYLLAGRPPFPDGTLVEKLLQHQKETPVPVEQARRARLLAGRGADDPRPAPELLHVPAEVERILQKLMAKDPGERFQTPAEVAHALEEMLARWEKDPPKPPACDDTTVVQSVSVDLANQTTLPPRQFGSLSALWTTPLRRVWAKRPRRTVTVALIGAALFVGMLMSALANRRPHAGQPQVKGLVEPEPVEESVWKGLLQRVQAKKPDDLDALRLDLARFRSKYFASPHAYQVGALLPQLPSYFDLMDRSKIEKQQWLAWQPKEVVGVLGKLQPLKDLKTDWRLMQSVALSPDGRYVVAGGTNGIIRAWDLSRTGEQALFGHMRSVARVAFSPDGQHFASASLDGTTKVFGVRSQTLVYTLDKFVAADDRARPMTSVAYHPSGMWIATAGFEGAVRLWDASTGLEKKRCEGGVGKISALTFTPDGKHLVWAGEKGEIAWTDASLAAPPHTGVRLGPGATKFLSFSADGKWLLCGGSPDGGIHVCVWDGKGLKQTNKLREHDGIVHEAAFAPDGKTFVSVGDDKMVKLWDVRTLKVEQAWEMRWPVSGVAFAPDGRHFVTANANNTLYVFRPGTPQVQTAALPQ